MASATSDFRPLTFSFRFKRFVSSSERNVFPPLPETFRFLQRLQCFLQRFTFRSFRFLDPLVFISFQGAAAAAAGRGSPPPPRAGEARWFATSVSCLCFVFPFRKDRCVLMISRKTRRGLTGTWFPSPLARGGPGGARIR